MTNGRRLRFGMLAALCMLCVVVGVAMPARAIPAPRGIARPEAASRERQAAFAAAAREFGVPANVLLAVS